MQVGSIPACTGEPWACMPRRATSAVYPRVYGGTHQSSRNQREPQGLSPRVRGNLAARHLGMWGMGSIPACTGEPKHT